MSLNGFSALFMDDVLVGILCAGRCLLMAGLLENMIACSSLGHGREWMV